MSKAHAILGASSMHIWAECGGYFALAPTVPDSPTSEYAAAGVAAHDYLEHFLKTNRLPPLGQETEVDGHKVVFDQDMLDAVRRAKQIVMAHAARGTPWRLALEQRVAIKSLADRYSVDLFGTADILIWFPTEKRLKVFDYKHGTGVVVSAVDNDQIRFYALAAIESLGYDPDIIELGIIQPRVSNDPSIETLSRLDLEIWKETRLRPAVEGAVTNSMPFKAGSHCRFCRVRSVCPELRRSALDAAKLDFDPVASGDKKPPTPSSLSNTELGALLDKAVMIEAWVRAVRGEASGRIDRGQQVPGWKLVEKRAVRKWTDVDKLEEWARGAAMHSVTFQEKAISVAELQRAMMRIGNFADFPDDLVSKESSGTTLVPDKDPREEAPSGPKYDFTEVKTTFVARRDMYPFIQFP